MFNAELEQYSKSFLDTCNTKSVNELWNDYRSKLLSLQEKYVPSSKASDNRKLPWINVKVRRCLRRKQRLYNQARKKHDPELWNKYRHMKRATQKLIRQQYWDYINSIVSSPDDQARKGFWSYVKKLKRDSVGISILKQDGRQATSPEEKANMLNKQFSSVFTEEGEEPQPEIASKVKYPSINKIKISDDGVKKQLANLNQNKAGGPDNISARILKETAHHVSLR